MKGTTSSPPVSRSAPRPAGSEAELAPLLLAGARAQRGRLLDSLREISSLDAPSGDAAALAPVAELLESWLRERGGRVSRRASAAGPSSTPAMLAP